MKSRQVIYLGKELKEKLNRYIDSKREHLVFNKETNHLFGKSYLISKLLETFFNSGLSPDEFSKRFPSLKDLIGNNKLI